MINFVMIGGGWRAEFYLKIARAIPEKFHVSAEPTHENTTETVFEPYKPTIRKSGTGCVYQINDTPWEGSFYPRMPDGKRKKFNVYAKTREECEEKLAVLIVEMKAEIKAEKERRKQAANG